MGFERDTLLLNALSFVREVHTCFLVLRCASAGTIRKMHPSHNSGWNLSLGLVLLACSEGYPVYVTVQNARIFAYVRSGTP